MSVIPGEVQNKNLRFEISDSGDIVKALLFEDENSILDYENSDSKPVRICMSLPQKETLLQNFKNFAQSDPLKPTIESQFEFYIRCREREIFEQMQEIRKSIKRIKSTYECVKSVKQIWHEYKKNQHDIKNK